MYPRIPFSSPSAASFIARQMASFVAGFSRLAVRSTTETSKVGTRMEIPVNLPFNDGMTFPTALAAPVEDGMMLPEAARPPLQSFIEGPSTVFWVAVVEWTVVIKPSLIPNLSFNTLAIGARQLVVQEAFDTNFVPFSYALWFTPQTNMGVSSFDGADITTYFAPASICP